jgi:DNA-binding IclR family transcriptional regulator
MEFRTADNGGSTVPMADSPVLKAMLLLRQLAEHRTPVGVQQLGRETGLNVSTVHRLLQLLTRDGMVSYEVGTRVYGIGTECIRFAARVLGSDSLIGRVRPIIAELAGHLGETCAFTLYESKTFSKVIAIVERGPQPLGYDFEVGARDGIHAGASGKPILGFLPDDEIEQMLRQRLPRLTEHTVVDPEEIRRQVRQIRKRGYATSHGERVPGMGHGVGAPVFGPQRKVIGSVVATIPSFRWRSDRLAAVARTVMDYAERASVIADSVLAQPAGANP